MSDRKINLCLARLCGKEMDYIKEAFETNWVTQLGPNVDRFEAGLEDFIGENKKIAALSSCTAAIHLALLQLGVKPGDDVVCQSFTFCASVNPVVYLGARPVLVDSEYETWNMNPELLEYAIKKCIAEKGKTPKAVIPVHLYGMPAKMDEIATVASRYGIPVLEDAAEALGSEYKGRKCGTFGDFATFSFNGNKIITTSGGGALVCGDEESKRKTVFYATQAKEDFPYYQHETVGYNYRMSNICAGVGCGQMHVLDNHIRHHRHVHSLYEKAFEGIDGIKLKSNPTKDFNSNYWLSAIIIDKKIMGFDRDDVRIALENSGIESRPLWKPMHMQPVFRDCPNYVDGTSESLFENGLCLPSGPWVSDDDVKTIVKCIINCTGKMCSRI